MNKLFTEEELKNLSQKQADIVFTMMERLKQRDKRLADTMRENERLREVIIQLQDAQKIYSHPYKDREITPEELNHLAENNAFIQSLKRTKI